MVLCFSAHEERIEELRSALALISEGGCTVDIRRGDGVESTLEVNWMSRETFLYAKSCELS